MILGGGNSTHKKLLGFFSYMESIITNNLTKAFHSKDKFYWIKLNLISLIVSSILFLIKKMHINKENLYKYVF